MLKVEILRQKSYNDEPYVQTILYPPQDGDTVARMLTAMNATADLRDINGEPVGKIYWQCSCLQKKCGACAMLINGRPRLACDTKLSEFKKGRLRLEPLKKFPTVRDLTVDRSVMFENLKALGVWLEQEAQLDKKSVETAYNASRCLQCGCCLEVCPNFVPKDSFFSAAAIVPVSRVISELPKNAQKELVKNYKKNIYSGCGKSLSCMNVCPAGIEVQNLLVNSNAVAVWKKRSK